MNLTSIGDALRLSLLEVDMAAIFRSFDAYATVDVYPSPSVPGMYATSAELYRDILKIVRAHGRQNDLLEMMPYIDDYICCCVLE